MISIWMRRLCILMNALKVESCEIVTYISRLNPEWKYIALLRSRLFALQKKLQKEVK